MPSTFSRFFIAAMLSLLGVGGNTAQAQTNQAAPLVIDQDGAYPIIFADKSKVCNDIQFYDAAGVLQTGERDCTLVAPPDCSSDGQVGCKTTNTHKAVQASNLTRGNIRTGVTIGGLAGQYPSAVSPLAGASATADLDLATFNSKIKSSSLFEWFDSAGNVYSHAGEPNIDAASILNGVSIFGTVGTYVPPQVCGGAGNSCYDNATALAHGTAVTPSGKNLVFVTASGAFKVWKDASSNRILRANGLDEWAMKLNLDGKGFSASEFMDYTSLEGRKCPPSVYIDDSNKVSANNCLYYTVGYAAQPLNVAGTSQADPVTVGLNDWSNYNSSEARWYVGNIKTCSDLGMRLPTVFETATTTTVDNYYPTIDVTPTFAVGGDGIPSHDIGYTWTASANSSGSDVYWLWSGSLVNSTNYGTTGYVRCTLP